MNRTRAVACANQAAAECEGGVPKKITYDAELDVLRILISDAPIEESDEEKPGIILDYDKDGNVVGLEVLDASRRTPNPLSVEYQVTGA